MQLTAMPHIQWTRREANAAACLQVHSGSIPTQYLSMAANSDHNTDEERTSIVEFRDYYGRLAAETPPIDLFLGPPVESFRSSRGKMVDDFDWAREALQLFERVVEKFGLEIIIVEVSVIQDGRMLHGDDPYFVSNIVCAKELNNGATKTPVLSAYLEALDRVSEVGTTMNRNEFHTLHYVHIKAPQKKGRGRPRREGSFTYSGERRRVAIRRPDPKDAGGDKKFAPHYEHIFGRFLETLEQTEGAFLGANCHYLTVPFRRPAADPLASSMRPALEPAGAVYLILRDRRASTQPDATDRFGDLAARVQTLCTLACLRGSAGLLDTQIRTAEANRSIVSAYDAIGHTLRTFVNATGYEGARSALTNVVNDERLPSDLQRNIIPAIEALSFFQHAEALGSLMRLHGWVGGASSGGAPEAHKVINCFHQDQIESVRNQSRFDNVRVIDGVAALVRGLALQLADKDETSFRISYLSRAGVPNIQHLERNFSGEREGRAKIPPLQDVGDLRAVKLALTVALLEPLRNASEWANRLSSVPKSLIEILLSAHPGGIVKTYIGNGPLERTGISKDEIKDGSGVKLVRTLLESCHLGNISFDEDGAGKLLQQLQLTVDYKNYAWVVVEFDALSLFDHAKELERRHPS